MVIAQEHHPLRRENNAKSEGIKHKDLCMVPNRLSIALQDDGWYIRSEIIWHKPSCMPESVTDRPTQAHEKIWLLTKSPKYYYDFYGVVEHLRSSPKPRGQKLDDSRGDGPRRNEIWEPKIPIVTCEMSGLFPQKDMREPTSRRSLPRWSRDV